jgi:hypothetical protein
MVHLQSLQRNEYKTLKIRAIMTGTITNEDSTHQAAAELPNCMPVQIYFIYPRIKLSTKGHLWSAASTTPDVISSGHQIRLRLLLNPHIYFVFTLLVHHLSTYCWVEKYFFACVVEIKGKK